MAMNSVCADRRSTYGKRWMVLVPVLIAVASAHARGQGQLLPPWDGEADDDYFGSTLASAGDTNFDGHDDVLVGAWNHAGAGRVYLYSGVDGVLLNRWDGESVSPQPYFGYAVSSAGDVNHDGAADVLIGAYGAGGVGSAYLYSGNTADGYSQLHRWDGVSGSGFGYSVAGVGDVDGDGTPDIAIGAPTSDWLAQYWSGAVYVFSGADLDKQLFAWGGAGRGDMLGTGIAALGDVNNDGKSDVAAAASAYPNFGGTGRVYSYSGSDGLPLWPPQDGESPGDFFGSGLAGGVDVDGDGAGDVLIGAYGHDIVPGNDSNEGKAYLLSGATGGILSTWGGAGSGDYLYRVSVLGDVNADGHGEILLGAPGFDGAAGSDTGKAYLYSGANYLLLWSWEGERAGDALATVAGLGDTNDDRIPDMALGAPLFDPTGKTDAGRLYVIAGNDLYLDIAPDVAKGGDTVTLTTRAGRPSNFVIVVVTGFDGTQWFLPITPVLIFDSNGELVLSGALPYGLGAHDVTFQSYAIGWHGRIVDSNARSLTLQ